MIRFLIIYGSLVIAFCLGWLIASLFASGKIRRREAKIRALHLLRDEENKAWLETLTRSAAAHKRYQIHNGGIEE